MSEITASADGDERYRRLLEAAPTPIAIYDRDAVRFANRACREFLDVADEERVVGMDPSEFFSVSEAETVRERMTAVLERRESLDPHEYRITTAAGEVRYAVMRSEPVTFDGRAAGQVVVTDVTEYRDTEAELERERRTLQTALDAIDDFFFILDPIRAAAERMESLVDDMLALGRHGQVVSDRQSVELERVAREAWSRVRTGAATLVVDESRTLEADPERLAALFENLYRNAVEHGSADEHGGETRSDSPGPHEDVTIRVGATERGFAVHDDGRGLPGDRGDLFEYGVTYDEGTGLGLAIVAEICGAHGWTVVASDAERGGARFDVRF